jgi:beta-lactamase class D
MKKNVAVLIVLLLAVLLGSCASPAAETSSGVMVNDGWGDYFEGNDGCFELYDLNKDQTTYYGQARCAQRFLPASTFKILSSLIALESGAIADENEVIPWDSTQYLYDTWNRDQTLRTAIQESVVWAYQELARRVGTEKMQAYVEAAEYGNADISGRIDSFWLDGALRISADEQIDVLKRLYFDDLPFYTRNIEIVKNILILEETDAYTLRGKTGSALRAGVHVGWFVGYLERGEEVYFFACNFGTEDDDVMLVGLEAKAIALEILADQELLPE